MGRHQRRRHGVAVDIYALTEQTDRRGNVQAAPDLTAPAATMPAAKLASSGADLQVAGQLAGERVTLHLDPHEAIRPGAVVGLEGELYDVREVKDYGNALRALRHVAADCVRRPGE